MVATQERPAPAGSRSLGRLDWATWPKYEAAVLGFRDYWYPVTWSAHVRRRSRSRSRSRARRSCSSARQGKVLALYDRCPTAACRSATRWPARSSRARGRAATTAGRSTRERPARGRHHRRARLADLRQGRGQDLPGRGEAGPGVPLDRRRRRRCRSSRTSPRSCSTRTRVVDGPHHRRGPGNWRFGAENGFDDGHAKYLHRNALWTKRVKMPVWGKIHVVRDGPWLDPHRRTRITTTPSSPAWASGRRRSGSATGRATRPRSRSGCRAPSGSKYETWTHFEWWVPTGPDEHIYVQLATMNRGPLENLRFRLYYRLWVRWVFHGMFNDEDRLMVDVMDAPPERLYRPDVAITEWRKMVEETARGEPITEAYRRHRRAARARLRATGSASEDAASRRVTVPATRDDSRRLDPHAPVRAAPPSRAALGASGRARWRSRSRVSARSSTRPATGRRSRTSRFDIPGRRVRVADRPVRLRQVDAAAARLRPVVEPTGGRIVVNGMHAGGGAPPAPVRDRVPVAGPVRLADGRARTSHCRSRSRAAPKAEIRGAGGGAGRPRRTGGVPERTTRSSCRAGCSSASRLPGH